MMQRWTGGLLALALAVALIGIGCRAKKTDLGLAGEGPEAGMGEERLGGTPGGSLDLARAGRLGTGTSGPLQEVHFEYDSFDLTGEARRILQQNAEWLNGERVTRVEIEGHCDERGTVEYNLALGAKRASAVKEYLASLGVDTRRMTTISYGEELPLCHDQMETCWSRNRRANFVLVGE